MGVITFDLCKEQLFLCCLLLYSAILCSQADSLHPHVILHEWLAFYSTFLNIHQSAVQKALTWLVPHETAAISSCSVYTIQLCAMSLHAKPHAYSACIFSCNLPPALLAEWPGSFACYCSNTGVEWLWVLTESWPWRRKFSCRCCRDLNLQPFNHHSGALTTEFVQFTFPPITHYFQPWEASMWR